MRKFDNDMKRFAMENKRLGKRPNATVLYGSSTFTRWTQEDIERDLINMEVINRGFGDSSADEALDNFDVAVCPIAPRIMIYYEGANDIARGQSVEASFINTVKVYHKAREMNPDVLWVFLRVHMCPGRVAYHASYRELNQRYKDFCEGQANCYWVDINPMIHDAMGNIRDDIYIEDGLHFTPKGYKEFGEKMYENLINILEKEGL